MLLRRALSLALCTLLVAGCAFTRTKFPKATGGMRAESPEDANRVVPGPAQVVGRVIAVDPRTLTVIIELAPYATMPARFDGQTMIARANDLRPTARLEASRYLRGRTLGARIVAGKPRIDDEVVFPPASP